MRRVAVLALLVLAVSAGPALSAPQSVSIALFEFKPATVTVNAGEAVTWTFSGPDTNHSVTSNPPGQAETFDSDPGKFPSSSDHPAGDKYSHTFTKPGRYTYFCKVHPSMEGTVVVNNADGTPPAPPEDTTKPRVTSLKVSRGVATFRLSERATLQLRVLKGSRTVKRKSATGRKGANRVKLPRLAAGTYRLRVRATDLSTNANFVRGHLQALYGEVMRRAHAVIA